MVAFNTRPTITNPNPCFTNIASNRPRKASPPTRRLGSIRSRCQYSPATAPTNAPTKLPSTAPITGTTPFPTAASSRPPTNAPMTPAFDAPRRAIQNVPMTNSMSSPTNAIPSNHASNFQPMGSKPVIRAWTSASPRMMKLPPSPRYTNSEANTSSRAHST